MSSSSPAMARGTFVRGGSVVAALLLSVVVATPAAAEYEVADGETLSQIAQRHRVAVSALASANNIADPDVVISGTVLVIPDGDGGTTTSGHVVRPGEVLSAIAAQHGVSVAALAAANGISNPDLIYSGRTLALQGSGGQAEQSGGQAASPAEVGGSLIGDGTPADRATVRQLITDAAASRGWNPAIPLGLAMMESGWNNTVVSSAGALGLFQVLPATGEWAGTYLLNRAVDLRDPADNVAVGMAYLDYLYDRFDGNAELAVAAYFEGPRRTEAAGGPSTPAAQRYVDNVLAVAERYR